MLDHQISKITLVYSLEPYFNHVHSLFNSLNKEV
jgi:hypothetical protein